MSRVLLSSGCGTVSRLLKMRQKRKRLHPVSQIRAVSSLSPRLLASVLPSGTLRPRGAILGLTRGSTRAEVIRATFESIAYQSADVVTAMVTDADMRIDRLRVDGGATANNFLMQFQADILGIDVERPAHIESTGLGAAYLAGLTTGMWNDVAELAAYRAAQATSVDEVSTGRVFSPQIDTNERNQKLSQWKKAVERVMC